jgi:parallel beta-helix repeat protein
MEMKRNYMIMVSFITFFFIIGFNSIGQTTRLDIDQINESIPTDSSAGIDTSWVVKTARKPRPIYIEGNRDFDRQAKRNGWPGTGTEFDPYIIQYIELSMPLNSKAKKFRDLPSAITIKDTDVFFIIQYCVLTSIDGNYHGIHLSNVVNGEITRNIMSNFASAIFLDGSNNNIITYNIINGNVEETGGTGSVIQRTASLSHGIFLDPSDNNLVAYNEISDYTGNGLYVLNSSHNELINNDLNNSHGENGVFLAGSDWNTIVDNEIYGYIPQTIASSPGIRMKIMRTASLSRGIFLDPSNNNLIMNNNISDFTGQGVYLLESDGNVVQENNIDSGNVGEENASGIFLEESDDNVITENTLYGSDTESGFNPDGIRFKIARTASLSHGIFLDPSNNNTISNNYISDFTGNGLYLLDSDNNLLTQNYIDNNLDSQESNGVFLAGSDSNTITDNDIFSSETSSTSGTGIRFKIARTASLSRGIFLDPSNNNTVSNNRISGYDADGLYLLDSDFNEIYNNDIDNSIGTNGVFLNGSNWNDISYNDIWGEYSASSSTSTEIRFKISRTASLSRGIFLDPSSNNTITNNNIHNITGDGVFLQSSGDNDISGNEIGGNAGAGVFLEDSWDTSISSNIIYNEDLHGIGMDNSSIDNVATENDLIANNVGGSQMLDDGIENQFVDNFLIDHDNRDGDSDGTSDSPYYIEGSAGSTDPYPSALPVQPLDEIDLNLVNLTALVDYESETLNLKNEGQDMNVKIKLPDGYSVTNINISTVFTDGYSPYNYADPGSITYSEDGKLIVKFNRSALIEYLQDTLPYTPIDVQLNVTGWLNGHFLSPVVTL